MKMGADVVDQHGTPDTLLAPSGLLRSFQIFYFYLQSSVHSSNYS
jgi:hypothetical protein